MSAEETDILDRLLAAGASLEILELSNDLLRENKLAPPLNVEIVQGDHIMDLGADIPSLPLQVAGASSSREAVQGESMIDLDLLEPRRPKARSSNTSSSAPSSSSRDGRSGKQQMCPQQQQKRQVLRGATGAATEGSVPSIPASEGKNSISKGIGPRSPKITVRARAEGKRSCGSRRPCCRFKEGARSPAAEGGRQGQTGQDP